MARSSEVSSPARATSRLVRRLAVLGAVSAWSTLPPYVAELDVAADVEFVDHVVPGALAALMAACAIVLARRGDVESPLALGTLGVCALCGLWELATHVPLVFDAGTPGAPVGKVVLHSGPGPVMLLLALWLLLVSPDAPASGDRC